MNNWQPINTAPNDDELYLIGRHNGINFVYIHAAFRLGGLWFLPFDSERDDSSTPYLPDDELPTHWMELQSELKEADNG